jgi:hypothetical protein
MDYNAINFKNRDIDKFSTKFGREGDPVKKSKDNAPADRTSSTATLPTFQTTSPKSTEKDWRDRSRVGAAIHGTPYAGGKDKGGKKNCTVKEGKGGRPDYSKMDESCKKP